MTTDQFPVAATWFERTPVDAVITRITEPHVHPLLRANIWHVRGRDRDLVIDCGLGVASLRAALPDLFTRDPILVLTHAHLDHMGSAYEFDECWAHPAEPVSDSGRGSLNGAELSCLIGLDPLTLPLPETLLRAIPVEGYDPRGYRLRGVRTTRHLREADVIDLGDRTFKVLHLPGHSPGSIALYDETRHTLFSGDVLYDDDALLDTIIGADRTAYRRTMHRLRELPVDTLHAGHEHSVGADRTRELIDTYLSQTAPRTAAPSLDPRQTPDDIPESEL